MSLAFNGSLCRLSHSQPASPARKSVTCMMVLNGKASRLSLSVETFIISTRVVTAALTLPSPTCAFTKIVVVTTSGATPSLCHFSLKK